jgi:hypothetical protein
MTPAWGELPRGPKGGEAGSAGPGRAREPLRPPRPRALRAGMCAGGGRFFRGYSGHFSGVFREFPAGPSTLGNSRVGLCKPLKSNRSGSRFSRLLAAPVSQVPPVAPLLSPNPFISHPKMVPGDPLAVRGPYPRLGDIPPGHTLAPAQVQSFALWTRDRGWLALDTRSGLVIRARARARDVRARASAPRAVALCPKPVAVLPWGFRDANILSAWASGRPFK